MMWAITSFYNPARYERRAVNYRTFRAGLAIPLVTVELSFDGRFELSESDADILVQIQGTAVLWQKERLLNVALAYVPKDETSVAWLDCDILLPQVDWPSAASSSLATCPVVQLFSDRVDLLPGISTCDRDDPPTGRGIISLLSSESLDPESDPMRLASFGLAWAGRRDFLERHSFYDAMIVGSGDRAMVCGMLGLQAMAVNTLALNASRAAHYLRWAEPVERDVSGNVECLSGRLYHLWHGESASRRYRRRHNDFARFDFDPAVDIRVSETGAWEWARSRPDLDEFLRGYFDSRAEDTVGPQLHLGTGGEADTAHTKRRDVPSIDQKR
jgi:hypothetical protein